jgi:hypothetical protein
VARKAEVLAEVQVREIELSSQLDVEERLRSTRQRILEDARLIKALSEIDAVYELSDIDPRAPVVQALEEALVTANIHAQMYLDISAELDGE